MTKFRALLTLSFKSLLITGASIGRRRSKKTASSVLPPLLLIGGLSLYLSGLYSTLFASAFAAMGNLPLLIAMMGIVAAVLCLLFTVFGAQGVLFGGKDNDLMFSLPVSSFSLLLCRTSALYLEVLLFSGLLLLPAGVVYLLHGGAGGALVLLRLVPALIFFSFLLTAVCFVCAYVFGWIASKLARNAPVRLALYLAFFILIFVGSMRLSTMTNQLLLYAAGLERALSVWGAPFLWLSRAVCYGDLPSFLLLALVGALPFVLVVWFFSRRYQAVVTALASKSARSDFKLSRVVSAGQRQALLRKELIRLMGSPLYFVNTAIGPILLLGGGIYALIRRADLTDLLLLLEGELPILPVAVLAVCGTLSTAAISASSISLEGKSLWLLRAAPLAPSFILTSKAAFHVLVCLPCLLIGGLSLGIALGLSPSALALMLAAGFLYTCFTALFGLWMNLLHPKLDAINDAAVVKQSMSAFLATFGNMIAVGLGALFFFLFRRFFVDLTALLLCLLLLALLTLLLMRLLLRGGARRFERLD